MSDDLLGQLCWYTVSTGSSKTKTLDITPEQLEGWFEKFELDRAFLPKQLRSADAFRSATTGQTDEYVSEDTLRYRLYVEGDSSDPNLDTLKRYVMRQAVAGGRPVRVADIIFYRPRRLAKGRVSGSEDLKTRLHVGLGGVDKRQVQGFVQGCVAQYEERRRSLTPHRMRVLLREYLIGKGAISLRDGLYFLPPEASEVAQSLRSLTAEFGGRSHLMLVPLVDGDEQRMMIRDAIDSHVEERIHAILEGIEKVTARNPKGGPSSRLTSSWREEHRRLQALVERYGDAWSLPFPGAADALEDLQSVISRLTPHRPGVKP